MKKNRLFTHNYFIKNLPSWLLWLFPIVGILGFWGLPFLLTRNGDKYYDYTETGQIGDTIGGIAGPVIAFFAAFLTFLAFWIQYQANKTQTKQFGKQDKDTKIDRFENKFYELIQIHRDNVAEINIAGVVRSRKAFVSMFNEFKVAYFYLKEAYDSLRSRDLLTYELKEQELMNISFIIFFMGVGETSDKLTLKLFHEYETALISHYIDNLKKIQKKWQENEVEFTVNTDSLPFTYTFKYKPFSGHMSRLGHYYRHLFQTVKFVAEYNEAIINEKKKYEYLKTLRAQLSNHEQLLLYYNGLSALGKPWLEKDYFTDYRMIKNIPLPLADFGVTPHEKLGKRNSKGKLLFEWDEIVDYNKS